MRVDMQSIDSTELFQFVALFLLNVQTLVASNVMFCLACTHTHTHTPIQIHSTSIHSQKVIRPVNTFYHFDDKGNKHKMYKHNVVCTLYTKQINVYRRVSIKPLSYDIWCVLQVRKTIFLLLLLLCAFVWRLLRYAFFCWIWRIGMLLSPTE